MSEHAHQNRGTPGPPAGPLDTAVAQIRELAEGGMADVSRASVEARLARIADDLALVATGRTA